MTLFFILSSVLILISLGILLVKSKDLQKWQSVVFAIAAPLLVAIIYHRIGTPDALTFTQSEVQTTQSNTADLLSENQLGPEQIQKAITSLQEKVDNDPNDIQSLNLLANTYLITEQSQLAVLTLEKLIALGQNDSDTLIKTADAYAFAEQGVINIRAQQLLQSALQQNPNHPQGLWLAGMAAIQSNELVQAKNYWNRLLPLVAGSPQEQQLNDILAELEQRQSSASVSNTTPSNNNKIDAQKITVNIALAENLRQENSDIQDGHTIFIFARAKNGPKAPLAVKRLAVKDLPMTVNLTEQDAMLPQATISQFEDIILSAKISKSGDPSIKEGDIQSQKIDINMSQKKDSYTLTIK